MSNPKNTALANFGVFMNSFGKVRSVDEKQKTRCQMTTNVNANENDREIPDAGLRRKIEERAYYIWLASGRRHGDHERHWLEAERELMETAKEKREQRSGGRGGTKTGKPHKS